MQVKLDKTFPIDAPDLQAWKFLQDIPGVAGCMPGAEITEDLLENLRDNGVSIWNEWADENGDLGHIYGYQWRSWPTPVHRGPALC